MIDLNDKNILVTGANGMIGKELIRILKEEYKPRYIKPVIILYVIRNLGNKATATLYSRCNIQ